jgi:hypothetical protein
MHTVSNSNIAVAIIALVCLLLFNSPFADPRRLAVASQLARLHNGTVSATEFDYRYLRWEAGRWGLNALNDLSTQSGDAVKSDIASRAQQMLVAKNRWDYQQNAPLPIEATQRIRVFPLGEKIDDTLLNLLREARTAHWQTRTCLDASNECLAWINDLNNDGNTEVLIISSTGPSSTKPNCCAQVLLFEKRASQWTFVAQYHGDVSVDEWKTALDKQNISKETPRWPDLKLNDKTLRMNVLVN